MGNKYEKTEEERIFSFFSRIYTVYYGEGEVQFLFNEFKKTFRYELCIENIHSDIEIRSQCRMFTNHNIKKLLSKFRNDRFFTNFTSEELLNEVINRNDIYISSWWNSDHISDNTGLPRQYHNNFFSYCNRHPLDDIQLIREPVEQWLESTKVDLHTYLVNDWFLDVMAFGGCAEVGSEDQEIYRDFLRQRLSIHYDNEFGFHPEIDLSYKKEDENVEEIQNIILDLINVFKPHQGNLKTHLEEKMQELIDDYLSF